MLHLIFEMLSNKSMEIHFELDLFGAKERISIIVEHFFTLNRETINFIVAVLNLLCVA